MWTKFLFVLCFTVYGVCSEEQNIEVNLNKKNADCSSLQNSYTFVEGTSVSFTFTGLYLNHAWIRLIDSRQHKQELINYIPQTVPTLIAQKYQEGTWEFEMLYLQNVSNNGYNIKMYNNTSYHKLICTTKVFIVPAPIPSDEMPAHISPDEITKYIVAISVVSVVAAIIIIAEAVCIFRLKTQAKRGSEKYNNLEKLSPDTPPSDRARYCSDPGKKIAKMVEPPVVVDSGRESVIYEAPNIEIPDKSMLRPPPSEHPPAIPCTPRPDRNAMTSQTSYPSYPRPKTQEREVPVKRPPLALPVTEGVFEPFDKSREFNMAKRPPIPVPTEEAYEVYEEMEPDQGETYEPPPDVTLPPRAQTLQSNMISKPSKLTPGFPQRRLELPADAQKFKPGNKPATTPKPNQILNTQGHLRTGSVSATELAEAMRRRNATKVPVQTIPESVPVKTQPVQSKPPISSKPKPLQHVKEEAIYSNQMGDSSDEEWTYEPLKPANSYNRYNQ